MTSIEYKALALKTTIHYLAEQGVKYRDIDFFNGWTYEMPCIHHTKSTKTVSIYLYYNDRKNPKRGKLLKRMRNKFFLYADARVKEDGIVFTYPYSVLDLESTKVNVSGERIEKVMQRIEKLLALSTSPNENEAIAASLKAQELLAQYNLDVSEVTGEAKREEISELVADVGVGNNWKLDLSTSVARSYCCRAFFRDSRKIYDEPAKKKKGGARNEKGEKNKEEDRTYHFEGAKQIIFFGYKSDILIARRVFMYLFEVNKRLGRAYEKEVRQALGSANGVYNSFCLGFADGVDKELSKHCKALMLVVPNEVNDAYAEKDLAQNNTEIQLVDEDAFEEGQKEGKRALNAQYVGTSKNAIEGGF